MSYSLRTLRPRSLQSLTATLALVGCAAALVGCSPDKGPGSLAVSYVLGNSKTCAELGIDRLEVHAFQGAIDMPSNDYEDSMLCQDDAEILIDAIEPGIYSFAMYGYDANGVAVLDNLGQPVEERQVEIFEAAESSIEATLTARPAELEVRWRLGQDGFGSCGGVGIDAFEIVAYQTDGSSTLLEAKLDCELAGDAQGYRLVPDPDRDLNGTLFGEVGIQAVDASGNSVGARATFAFDPPGPGYSVQLAIECTDLGCTEATP
jgi:hypothetical protein